MKHFFYPPNNHVYLIYKERKKDNDRRGFHYSHPVPSPRCNEPPTVLGYGIFTLYNFNPSIILNLEVLKAFLSNLFFKNHSIFSCIKFTWQKANIKKHTHFQIFFFHYEHSNI